MDEHWAIDDLWLESRRQRGVLARGLHLYYIIFITSYVVNTIVSGWVTVSTKVRRELWKKAKEYGVDVSEVLRNALEREIKEREREELERKLDAASRELRKLDAEEVIREIRDIRSGR